MISTGLSRMIDFGGVRSRLSPTSVTGLRKFFKPLALAELLPLLKGVSVRLPSSTYEEVPENVVF